MVAPRGVGPFHDPLWRVGATAQLVEGGSNGPYWKTAPADHHDNGTAPESFVIGSDEPYTVARSLVALLAVTAGDDALIDYLGRAGLTGVSHGRRRFVSPWQLTDVDLDECARSLTVRIGVVRLAEQSALGVTSTTALRSWGFTVNEFTPSQAD